MAKRMLIDATHSEETRVVVLSGNRLEEFDFETSTKKQLKGNIYLAKVTRVEPSLQACFVEFGGNRHGFLAFSEIHPDYWQIPVADREAMLAEERRYAERERERERHDREALLPPARPAQEQPDPSAAPLGGVQSVDALSEPLPAGEPQPFIGDATTPPIEATSPSETQAAPLDNPPPRIVGPEPSEAAPVGESDAATLTAMAAEDSAQPVSVSAEESADLDRPPPAPVESLGGSDDPADDDEEEEAETRRPRFKPMRHYKIQEVIQRRQVLLVQVVKEERGTKGAALTTYLSLAGRYCVLMPNTTRGGGISRRITSQQDRKRLKDILHDLDLPDGMAVILRTAGMQRPMEDIRRDYDYLMRLWDEVRELTLNSRAPTLVYEEGSLIKRSLRDLYSADIDEILVEGDDGHNAARNFMQALMPEGVGRIRLYDDTQVPLFHRFQVETQLDEMHENTVRLRSGGYIVINTTEALVAIDVNSGRATRERHIEETALKTNLEAAEEVARQLRLRDLAGLIVIDFIDMEEGRHIGAVERRLKDAMRSDRARIQIGRISAFGLLELSRQRLRPSLLEVSSEKCPHCAGTGLLRSTESSALRVLRGIEEEGLKSRAAELRVLLPNSVAVYMLNHKRQALAAIERRHGVTLAFTSDDSIIPPNYKLERVRTRERSESDEGPAPVRAGDTRAIETRPAAPVSVPSFEVNEPQPIAPVAEPRTDYAPPQRDGGQQRQAPRHDENYGQGGDDGRRRGRRRRRRGRRDEGDHRGQQQQHQQHQQHAQQHPHHQHQANQPAMPMNPSDQPQPILPGDFASLPSDPGAQPSVPASHTTGADGQPYLTTGHQQDPRGDQGERRRRRGRRGGRRGRGNQGPGAESFAPPQNQAHDANAPAPAPSPAPMPEPNAPRDPDEEMRARARALYAQASRFTGDYTQPLPQPPSTPAQGSHDWPWNRRDEAPEQPPAPVITTQTITIDPTPSEPAQTSPEPIAPVTASPAPSVEPEPEMKGPPKKGWWRRITN
jgi:ribonuclease E